MRGFAHEKKKLPFRDGHELDIGDRHGGRAPWLAVDQRHFTEDIVGRKIGHRLVADLDAHVLMTKSSSACSPSRKMTLPALTERVSILLPVKMLKPVSPAISAPKTHEGTILTVLRRPCIRLKCLCCPQI